MAAENESLKSRVTLSPRFRKTYLPLHAWRIPNEECPLSRVFSQLRPKLVYVSASNYPNDPIDRKYAGIGYLR